MYARSFARNRVPFSRSRDQAWGCTRLRRRVGCWRVEVPRAQLPSKRQSARCRTQAASPHCCCCSPCIAQQRNFGQWQLLSVSTCLVAFTISSEHPWSRQKNLESVTRHWSRDSARGNIRRANVSTFKANASQSSSSSRERPAFETAGVSALHADCVESRMLSVRAPLRIDLHHHPVIR